MLKCLIVVVGITAGLGVVIHEITLPATAQQRCPEGKKNGECIDPGLANSMRLRGRAAANPKASQTAPAIPANSDRSVAPPPNYYELNKGVFRSAPCRNTVAGIVC
jgi:hypothetical protein